jgi:cardiolipin synthase
LLSFDGNGHLGQIPFWLTATIIGRDIVILIGMIVIQFTVGRVTARPHLTGKIATVFQIGSVIWILLKWDTEFGGPWLLIWTIGAAVFTGVSGLQYVQDGIRQLSASPRSSGKAPPAK